MARRTHRRIGKQKRYGVQYKVRSAGFLVPKRFLEDEVGDEEREDVIGQPLETEQGK